MGRAELASLVEPPEPTDDFRSVAYRGKVAVAPTSFTERLQVTLDAFDDDMPFRAAWIPRPSTTAVQVPQTASATGGTAPDGGGTVTGATVTLEGWLPAAGLPTLPVVGEPCIVQFDEGGDAWAWTWPNGP